MRRALLLFIFSCVCLFAISGSAQEGYDWGSSAAESYWYSLANASALMNSGAGLPLSERDELLSRVIAEAGFARDEGHVLSLPLVVLPYAVGDPRYLQPGSSKWVSENQDQTVTTEGLAWMAIAYAAQAKQMERLYQIGIDQTRETRLEAMVRGILASEASNIAYSQMRDSNSGLYLGEHGASLEQPVLAPSDQLLMLWALSELASLADGYSLYRGTVSWLEASQRAEEIYHAIIKYGKDHPEWLALTPEDRALMVESLSVFAATLGNLSILEEVVNLIRDHSQALASEVGVDSPLAVRAQAVRALIAAQRMTGNEGFRSTAMEIWGSMQASWDDGLGIFRGPDGTAAVEYSASDVADLVGAFGAVIYGTGDEAAMAQYSQFFRTAIKIARLIYSERDEAGGDSDSDEVPASASAGGPYGIAPVFASKVQFKPDLNQWFVTNSGFESAGALYLASQLLWIGQRDHQSYIGPPRYGLPLSREAQFIGIQQQLAELRASQVNRSEVEALKTLLQGLEEKLQQFQEDIQKRLIGPTSAVTEVGLLSDELDVVKADVKAMSDKIASADEKASSASTDSKKAADDLTKLTEDAKKTSEKVDALDKRLKDIETKVAAVEEAQKTKAALVNAGDQTLTVVLIIAFIIVAFLLYRWVMRRAMEE